MTLFIKSSFFVLILIQTFICLIGNIVDTVLYFCVLKWKKTCFTSVRSLMSPGDYRKFRSVTRVSVVEDQQPGNTEK